MNLLAPCPACKFTLLLAFSASVPLAAQPPAPLRSTEIHRDHSVTFSYKDATATNVTLALDGVDKPIAMEKGETGIWTVTTQPLAPEIYGYHFEANGDRRLDPTNPRTTINLVAISNLITVPGATPQARTRRQSRLIRFFIPSMAGATQNQGGASSAVPISSSTTFSLQAKSSRWSSSCLSVTATSPSSAPTTSGKTLQLSTTTPISSPRRCLPKFCLVWSPNIASRKTATTVQSRVCRWVAWKVSKSVSPPPASSPGSAASAPPSTTSSTRRCWHRLTPGPPTCAFSGSPAELKTISSGLIANWSTSLKRKTCQLRKSKHLVCTHGWSGATI